jgi:hypothetical protein
VQYITHRRFKDNAICGRVNIPAFSTCDERDGVVYFCSMPICYTTSENAHQYFARNNDGQGMKRGQLTQAIQKKLAKRDSAYQSRWDKIWDDTICQKYKCKEYDDFWLWNHGFFNAEIEDLTYIAKLVGAKE